MNIKKTTIIETLDNDFTIDWGVEAINAPKVWNRTQGEGVKIVTIDTGCDVFHSELQHSVKSKFNMINKNFDVTDDYGHGSHVAGLLTGLRTGVAPKADLHVIKVLDNKGKGDIANVMDGITYAMNIGADVLSISLGSGFDIPLVLKQRIIDATTAGVTIVSAVGNKGINVANYPARMDEVIAVGGLDKKMKPTTFTNNGYDTLAPAVDILSTYKEGKYARMTGTSMSSPLVAGGIALLISFYRKHGKELRPSEIQKMVKELEIFDVDKLIG